MKTRILRTIFYGVLFLSTFVLICCNDYGDDIEKLEQDVAANKANIEALLKLVGEGKFVTSISQTNNGFSFTMNNGKSTSILNVSGTPNIVSIDEETKNWLIDGIDSGYSSVGAEGEPGQAPRIGENGCWEIVDSVTGEWKSTGKLATPVYVTEDPEKPLIWILHVRQKVGEEYTDMEVELPKTASITSLEMIDAIPVEIKVSGDANVPVNTNENVIKVLINPIDADVSKYTFDLVDSKGNSYFWVKAIQNTDEVIAVPGSNSERAASATSANNGIWNMTVSLKDEVDADALSGNVAYSLITKNAFWETVASAYCVKVLVIQDGI